MPDQTTTGHPPSPRAMAGWRLAGDEVRPLAPLDALIAQKTLKAVAGASIGIAPFPDHGDNIDHLIKMANSAMYQTKNSGKNNFALAPSL